MQRKKQQGLTRNAISAEHHFGRGDRVAAMPPFCGEHLGRYKTPKIFRFAELPRGPSGKVQRLKLLDLAAPAPPAAT